MMPQIRQTQTDILKIVSQVNEFISKKSSGIVVLPARASVDAVAAGTALYLTLLKAGKNATISSSAKPSGDFIGIDKITGDFDTGGSNLVISFPYQEGSIDKVDYNIQGDKFNMIIVPVEGKNKIQPDQVQYTYSGGKADFIIVIDSPNLNSLGEIYTKNQRKFESSTIINIDRHMINGDYGMMNLVSKSASSTSELVLKLIQEMKIEVDRDIATNLYSGIAAATNNFTAYSVNADTFEAVAILLRAGAVKKPYVPPNQYNRQAGGMPQMRTPSMNQFGGAPRNFGADPFMTSQSDSSDPFSNDYGMPQPQGQPNFFPQTQTKPVNIQSQSPANQTFERQSKSIGEVEKASTNKEGKKLTNDPAEFSLKPKIFSESGLV